MTNCNNHQLNFRHTQRVQALLSGNLPQGVDFYNWLREKTIVNQNVLNQVLFTDETCFLLTAIMK